MRSILELRHKIAATIIQYFMFEIQDSDGRLIIVMAMRVRHSGKLAHVFVDGRRVAEFKTVGEAVRHARSLAEGAYVELSGPALTFDGE